MKKLWMIAIALCAGMASCSESIDEMSTPMGGTKQFTATIATESRTTLGENSSVLWEASDLIAILQADTNVQYQYKLTGGAGTTTADITYTGVANKVGVKSTKNYAAYPYSYVTGSDADGVLNLTIPAEQEHGTLSLKNSVMVAKSEPNNVNLNFTNAQALIRFRFSSIDPGVETLKWVKIASASQPLSGAATVDFSSADKPVVKVADEGGKELTLTCGEEGVALGSEVVELYMAVSPTTFPEGDLTVTYQTNKNQTGKTYAQVVTLERNKITTITKQFSPDDFTGTTEGFMEPWDGVTVTEPAIENGAYLITTPAEWVWLKANKKAGVNIKLAADLDFGGNEVKGLGFTGEFDGQGYTMSNMTLLCGGSYYSNGLFQGDGSGEVTVKNVTIDNVVAECNDPDHGYVGVIFGDIQKSNVTLENVHVKRADLCGVQSVGGLVGFVASGKTLTLKNCSVSESNLTNYYVENESGFVAGLVGRPVGTVTATDCKVATTTVDAFYAARRGEASIQAAIGNQENPTGVSVGTEVIVKRTSMDKYVVVTPDNVQTIQSATTQLSSTPAGFNKPDCFYKFEGTFTEDVTISANAYYNGAVVSAVFDGSDAVFEKKLSIRTNSDNGTSTGQCTGTVTFQNIEAAQLELNSYIDVKVNGCTLGQFTSECSLTTTFTNNKVTCTNDHAVLLKNTPSTYIVKGNTIDAYKNAIQIVGCADQNVNGGTYEISNNTFVNWSLDEEDRAAVKIYNDQKVAPIDWPAEYEITADGKAFIEMIVGQNTFQQSDKIKVGILCRKVSDADKEINETNYSEYVQTN